MAVYQTLSVTLISQDVIKNQSTVRVLWKSQQTGSSLNMVEHDDATYSVYSGSQKFTGSVRYVLPSLTDHVILQKDFVFTHDANGQCQVVAETWMDTRISAKEVRLSKKLQLPTIYQASQLSAGDALIGNSSRLAISRKNTGFTHSIAWTFGKQSGYVNQNGGVSASEVKLTGESLDFQIPDSFYTEIPKSKKGQCTLTIRTYSGSTLIGQPKSTAFTVWVNESVCRPSVSGSVVDINSDTIALTGNSSTFIKHVSTVRCTVSAAAVKGASVTKKTVAGTQTQSTLDIAKVTADSIVFGVTDSRGLTAEFSKTLNLVPYVPVTCQVTAQRTSPVSGEATMTISGRYYQGSFGAAENAMTLKYSINGGTPVSVTPAFGADNLYSVKLNFTGMDYTQVYNITVWVSDRLTSAQKSVTLKKGVPVFDWGENDFRFNVPVDIKGQLNAEHITMRGMPLIYFLYPVGSVFTTYDAGTDPNTVFGGAWELIYDGNDNGFRWKRIN